MKYIHISVWQFPPGEELQSGTLRLDDPAVTILHASVQDGRLIFYPMPVWSHYGHHGFLTVNEKYGFHLTLAADIDVDIPPQQIPEPEPSLPVGTESGRWSIDRYNLRNEDGSLARYKGATDFRSFEQFCRGENIDDLVSDRIIIDGIPAANVLRVGSMYEPHIGTFRPHEFPDYYDKLNAYADYLAGRKTRFQLDVFLDAQVVMPNDNNKKQHFGKIVEIARSKWNMIISLGNEYPKNGFDPSMFQKPQGVLSTAGSTLADDVSEINWDMFGFHPGRRHDWYRSKGGKDIQERDNILVYEDEPMGADEVLLSNRDNNPLHWYWYGGMIGIFLSGATFHSSDGVFGRKFRTITRECAKAFYSAINSYPVDATQWRYSAGHISGHPIVPVDLGDTSRRSFAMLTGNRGFCISNNLGEINKGQNGWHIVREWGPNQSSIEVAR